MAALVGLTNKTFDDNQSSKTKFFSFFYKSYSLYDPEGYRQKNSTNSKKNLSQKGVKV